MDTWTFLDLVPNIQSQPAEMYATERCRSLTLPGGRSSTLNLLRVLTKSVREIDWASSVLTLVSIWTHGRFWILSPIFKANQLRCTRPNAADLLHYLGVGVPH